MSGGKFGNSKFEDVDAVEAFKAPGESSALPALLPCPCGNTPSDLCIEEGGTSKWAWVYGHCCGEWSIEFRTKYLDLGSPECMDLAIEAWNAAKRAR